MSIRLAFSRHPAEGSNQQNNYEYRCQDGIFEAHIFQGTLSTKWSYTLYWNEKAMLKQPGKLLKEIHSEYSMYSRLKDAKAIVSKLMDYLNRSVAGEIWLLKGIQLGFTDEKDMEHLKAK